MTIYYIVYGILLALCFIGESDFKYVKNSKKKNKIICAIMIVIAVFFCGLRNYDMWTDWERYFPYFNDPIYQQNNVISFEYGFYILNIIAHYVFKNYNVYLVITYFIVFILYYLEFTYVNDKYVPFSILVLFSINILSSGGFRQFVSTAILIYSLKYVKEHNIKKFLILILIACLFHISSIIFIITYFIGDKRPSLKKVLIVAAIGFVITELNIVGNLISFSYPLWKNIPSLAYRIGLYGSEAPTDNILISFGLFKRLFIISLSYFFCPIQDNESEKDKNFNLYLNLYIVGFLLYFFIPEQYQRLIVPFYLTETIVEPLILTCIDDQIVRKKIFLLLIILNVSIFFNTLNTYYPEYLIPYKFCFWR